MLWKIFLMRSHLAIDACPRLSSVMLNHLQIAILMGCAVLPHLKQLVEIIHHGLTDEQQKARTITALALAALAEAAHPYGIESFDPVLEPLWRGLWISRADEQGNM